MSETRLFYKPQLSISEVRSQVVFFPLGGVGMTRRRHQGVARNIRLDLGQLQGCVQFLSISWSPNLMICTKNSTDLDSTV